MITGTQTAGYYGTVFLEPYLYYLPSHFEFERFGKVLRYETRTQFSNSSNWKMFDLIAAFDSGVSNFAIGATSDRYVYFTPFSFGVFARYDSYSEFTNISSWQTFNANANFGMTHFASGCFDKVSKFMYFAPHYATQSLSVSYYESN